MRLSIEQNANNFVVDGDSLNYGIDIVRKLKKWSLLKPFNANVKLALIQHADKLTTEAQNALLKLIEEPPQDTLIFLTTKNKNLLLETIQSRCQTIDSTWFDKSKVGKSIKQLVNLEKIKQSTIEPFPTITGKSDALKKANEFSKKYKREELLTILEDWLDELLANPTPRNVMASNKIIDAKEQLSHNTNIELTLDVLFLALT